MKILKDNGKNCTLSIVGSTSLDPEYADSIRSLAKDLDLEVNILGEISEDELREIYLESHLFLFLNIEQSWGLAIFEAMSCGLPVIISESVGAVEILKGTKGVVILDPFNIEAVAEEIGRFSDKDYYLEMSYQAFLASREMSWDSMYSSKVEILFYNLVSKDPKIGASEK
jgi:glycosyltransferase involved in cell wall biosynthesis